MYINLHLYTGGGEVKKVSMTGIINHLMKLNLSKVKYVPKLSPRSLLYFLIIS